MKNALTLKGMLLGTVMAGAVAAAPAMAEIDESTPGAIKAVDLMAAWVNAGVPNGKFTYTDMSGNATTGTFDRDIL
ncbi:hypothetical protein ACFL12_08615, partial [Pseudomonadota bacterium]